MTRSEAANERVRAAIAALGEFLETELAASKIEAEAKLIESHHLQPPFEPAHLHDARVHLERAGRLTIDRTPTRGGGTPPIWMTTNTVGRVRPLEKAASRKRLLMSRYYAYAQGTQSTGTGLTGDAGEVAFHEAFRRASVGASLATVTRGVPNVPLLDGLHLDLDNAFALTRLARDEPTPIPPFGIRVLVEVKNVREWIYPRSHELYQVLKKGAMLQQANPDTDYIPMLVCRRAHATTRFMAKQVGFFVLEAQRHYFPVHSQIPPADLAELVDELALTDITQSHDAAATARIEQRLVTLQRYFDAETSLEHWKAHCHHPSFLPLLKRLEDERTQFENRSQTLEALRQVSADATGLEPGW